ncbi:unnamed protein product [Macrosiphum euphorbiae]|uniref:Uncharacterized protein n=1 Tax=Macrosiphum euphorbiae TaxID=13131 RepID=A0AAV0Y1Q4_9HEMI|nr:unnamed protein product [Macrosiphum euphorbiae]
MRDSINSKRNNLNVQSIKKYLDKGNKQPVLVFFGGSTDKEIVVRLGLGNYTMLELTSYDLCDNLVFYLQLKIMSTKKIIAQEEIGYADKSGRQLNLSETQKLVCNQVHPITYEQ